MTDRPEKCDHPLCQHHSAGYHHTMCPLESVERKLEIIRQLMRQLEDWKQHCVRRTATISIYQGKYHTLRHENNKLRKANDRLRRELAEAKGEGFIP